MVSKLKAAFGDPANGWVTLTLTYNGETFEIPASYIYDSIYHLGRALSGLWSVRGSMTVIWLSEPRETEMRFEKDGEILSLEIEQFPGHRRDSSLGTPLLSVSGDYAQVCLPFWRALRSLEGRFTEQELRERWRGAFPTREIEDLTAAIKNDAKVSNC